MPREVGADISAFKLSMNSCMLTGAQIAREIGTRDGEKIRASIFMCSDG